MYFIQGIAGWEVAYLVLFSTERVFLCPNFWFEISDCNFFDTKFCLFVLTGLPLHVTRINGRAALFSLH